MAHVHPTAVVHPRAQLHETVEVGAFCVIGEKVTIGAGSHLGSHVVIEVRTTLGERTRVFPFAAVGGAPQDLKYKGEDTQLILGEGNTIRESATLNIGTAGGGGVTRVGHHNLFMAYSHVAHDCAVGSGCIVANGVALAGHVTLEDFVILGGLSAVHQFTRLGKHSFIAGGSMVTMDVPPYCTAQGDRAELSGLNTVGLQRHGFSEEQIGRIKEAYKILFRSKVVLAEALERLQKELGGQPEIDYFLDFIRQSKRGLTR